MKKAIAQDTSTQDKSDNTMFSERAKPKEIVASASCPGAKIPACGADSGVATAARNVQPRRVHQLEEALSAEKTERLNLIRRLEASNSELELSNEQVIMINDELKSANEQLKSSQDELHDMNEALIASNQLLQLKVAELEASAAAQHALASSLEARVSERTSQIRILSAELALTSERERRLLAQDLHDGLAQLLAILKIKLTSIKDRERRGRVKVALREIEELIDKSNQSVRTLMLQLSPPVLQTLGLIPALEWLAEDMERNYNLVVHLDIHGVRIALNEPAKTTIFRAVRELLINVSKHAGCNVAKIRCLSNEDSITLSVTDEGNGFCYNASTQPLVGEFGFGLISIKDRIELIGGEMSIKTAPECGTTVTITFPSRQHKAPVGT